MAKTVKNNSQLQKKILFKNSSFALNLKKLQDDLSLHKMNLSNHCTGPIGFKTI